MLGGEVERVAGNQHTLEVAVALSEVLSLASPHVVLSAAVRSAVLIYDTRVYVEVEASQ